MMQRRARTLALGTIAAFAVILDAGCTSSSPAPVVPTITGGFTARVLPTTSSEASKIRAELQAKNGPVATDQDIAVVTVTWALAPTPQADNCETLLSVAHPAAWEGFAYVLDTPLQGGTDPSLIDAPKLFPAVFKGLPAPDVDGLHPRTQSTFTSSIVPHGSSRIIYYVDPAVAPSPNDSVSIAAVYECNMKALAAGRLSGS